MARSKYKQLIEEMYDKYASEFAAFQAVHDKYASNRKLYQDEFNRLGAVVMEYMRHSEKILCSGTENGGYGQYSAKLADTYWKEIKKQYPLVDFIGVRIQ